jgi:pimeloyl-ACP methyl ester carboxylesterase
MTNRFEFPIGYRHLHDDANYNFQLNRWLTYWDEEEVRHIAANISGLATWKSELLKAASTCEAEDRALNAAFFYRAAEFFIAPDDPDKLIAYNRFRELFYAEVTNPLMTRVNVPYESSTLPALIFPADGPKRDTVLVHGGFDSFKEEFIEMAATFNSQGIEFILFEGPGQGEPLMLNHLAMPNDWERPVGAILDHLQISSCSLIGISLGGYLAPRAAAFDKRIRRVVAYDVLEDFLGCLSAKLDPGAQKLLALLMRMRARHTINTLMSGVIKKDEFARWAFGHGMHVSGTTMPYDYLKWVESFTTAPFAALIDQDFLLLGGAEDHLVPLPQFFSQASNLPNVRSLTTRLFTDKEHASSHCQVGNLQLAADWIANWLNFQLEHPEIGT